MESQAAPASSAASARRPRVLIGATGSVATVKVPELVTAIASFAEVSRRGEPIENCVTHHANWTVCCMSLGGEPNILPDQVRVILTASSEHFFSRSSAYNPRAWTAFQGLGEAVKVYRDQDEWDAWNVLGDAVLHIQVRCWSLLPHRSILNQGMWSDLNQLL
jgi:phosphopantothenoylcysteine decarboxylase